MKLSKEISEKCTLDAGEAYKDMDGNMKQFTHVDHDPKLKIPTTIESLSEREERIKWMTEHRENNILTILALPAVSISGDEVFESLIIRTSNGFEWNEENIRSIIDPYILYTIRLRAWRHTIKEIHWFDPISEDHEAIIRGDWKSLM